MKHTKCESFSRVVRTWSAALALFWVLIIAGCTAEQAPPIIRLPVRVIERHSTAPVRIVERAPRGHAGLVTAPEKPKRKKRRRRRSRKPKPPAVAATRPEETPKGQTEGSESTERKPEGKPPGEGKAGDGAETSGKTESGKTEEGTGESGQTGTGMSSVPTGRVGRRTGGQGAYRM